MFQLQDNKENKESIVNNLGQWSIYNCFLLFDESIEELNLLNIALRLKIKNTSIYWGVFFMGQSKQLQENT